MPTRRRPSPALVVATAAFAVALGGVTYAAIPGGDSTIHSCYDSRGSLRVIDEGASCNQGETALDFAQKGPQGPAGAPGPAGQTKLLNFTRSAPVTVPRKAGAPIGSFDLPEGKWQITFTGGVKIPGSKPVALPAVQKLHSAALNAYRVVSAGPPVSCKLSMADGSVRGAAGNSGLIGLLLPAVQTQHGAGGGGGAGKGEIYSATIYMNLAQSVPAGGGHGVVACTQGKAKAGFSSPSAQMQDISIHAVEVNDVGALNFTPGR